MMDTVLSFVTSEPVGIFALLFLNNLLMYFVAKRHMKATVNEVLGYNKLNMEIAGRYEKSLRAVIHAFKDEAEGAMMPAFECGKCDTPADCEDWCYHVLAEEAQEDHTPVTRHIEYL